MKRIIIYIVFIIIFTSLGFIGLTYEKVDSPSENILNNTFYKYNTSSGLYESIKFNSKIVSYNGEELDLKGCDTYSYTAVSSIVKFTCGRAFRIIADTNEVLAISMNEIIIISLALKKTLLNMNLKNNLEVHIQNIKVTN